MTNGELFIVENPNIEFKLNGSCVWIYFDGVNHYTMPISWWEQEISLFDKIRAEIWDLQYGDEEKSMTDEDRADAYNNAIIQAVEIIDKYRAEGGVEDGNDD